MLVWPGERFRYRALALRTEAEFAADGFTSSSRLWLVNRSSGGIRVAYGERLRFAIAAHAGGARVAPNTPFITRGVSLLSYDIEAALRYVWRERCEVGLYAYYARLFGGAQRQLGFDWTTLGVALRTAL